MSPLLPWGTREPAVLFAPYPEAAGPPRTYTGPPNFWPLSFFPMCPFQRAGPLRCAPDLLEGLERRGPILDGEYEGRRRRDINAPCFIFSIDEEIDTARGIWSGRAVGDGYLAAWTLVSLMGVLSSRRPAEPPTARSARTPRSRAELAGILEDVRERHRSPGWARLPRTCPFCHGRTPTFTARRLRDKERHAVKHLGPVHVLMTSAGFTMSVPPPAAALVEEIPPSVLFSRELYGGGAC